MESSSRMASFHSAECTTQATGGDGVSVVLAHCECHLCNNGTTVIDVTNHFVLGFEAHSIGGSPYSVLLDTF